jgi:hypothetical protein
VSIRRVARWVEGRLIAGYWSVGEPTMRAHDLAQFVHDGQHCIGSIFEDKPTRYSAYDQHKAFIGEYSSMQQALDAITRNCHRKDDRKV